MKYDQDELYLLVDFLEEIREYSLKDSLYDNLADLPKYNRTIEIIKSLIKE